MTEPATRPEPHRSPLWQLTLARIRLFYREPSVLFWTFLFPILLTVALGIAFRSRPPEPIRVGVVAGSAAEATRAALAVRADVEASILEPGLARTALRTGRVAVVVEPGASPVLRFDPTRPESRLAHVVVDDLLERAAGRKDVLAPREETVTEPGSRYVDFLIPGLLGMNIMSTGLWGVGYVIVENRQKKLLKRLAATPMRRSHFLLSLAVVRSLFLALEVPFLLGFGVLAFGVPLRGAGATLAVVAVAGAVAFAGIGLLVAARAANVADGERAHQPRDDADDVDVGGLLLVGELPGAAAAAREGAAADLAERRNPRGDERGSVARGGRAPGRAARCRRRRELRAGAEALPLDLTLPEPEPTTCESEPSPSR